MLKNKFIKFFVMSILSIFSLNSFARADVRVVQVTIVGNLGSGKTFFRKALCGEDYHKIYTLGNHTTNTEYQTVTIPFSEDYRDQLQIKFFDTSGDSDIKSQIIDKRVNGSNFVVITVDSKERVKQGAYYTYKDIATQNVHEWQDIIKTKYPECFIILLGTKTDLLSRVIKPGMKESEYDALKRKLETYSTLDIEAVNYVMGSVTPNGCFGKEEFFKIIKERIKERNLYKKLRSIDDQTGKLNDYDQMQKEAHPSTICVLL